MDKIASPIKHDKQLHHFTTRGHTASGEQVSVSRGWVSVNGCIFSYYCYLILFIMACFFLLAGILFTTIAYRPQQVSERLGEWSHQLVESHSVQIAGPAFILLGLVMTAFSLILCHVSRRVNPDKDSAQLIPARSTFHLAAPSKIAASADSWLNSNHHQQRVGGVVLPVSVHVISAFSVVQNEEKSYFEPGYSDMSNLIVSDIACFPKGGSPASVRALALQPPSAPGRATTPQLTG